jgi:FdhD protein
MQPVNQTLQYYKYSREGWQSIQSRVISETAVSLTVNGEVWLSFMCTPTDLQALALGFLFNEQIITSLAEIANLHVCESGENIDIWLHKSVKKPVQWQRTSGCSGGFTQGQVPAPLAVSGQPVSPDLLLTCMDQLLQVQEVYREARGVHCSALSDGRQVIFRAEDIGRHNTLDKLAGRLLFEPVKASPLILLTTGRISSEMLTKALRMQVAVVLSRTSPTTRSIELARAAGITLIGYARRDQLLVYTHPERLLMPVEHTLAQPALA